MKMEPGQGWMSSVMVSIRTRLRKFTMSIILMMRSRPTVAVLLTLLSLLPISGFGTSAIAAPAHAPSAIAVATATMPPEVVNLLRQDLSKRTGIPANQLRFTEVSAQTWPDGCLGLARPGEICTQAMVPGWRATFANGNRRWVYRTNSSGSTFRLEPKTTGRQASVRSPQPIAPAQIPIAELPPRLQQTVLFRAIATGGFAGRTVQTTLYRDGRLVREELDLANQPRSSQVKQVDPQAVQQFMTVMRQQQLARWHRADYLPTPGSADFITMTLSCQSCTVRYADSIQGQLPTNLQAVIQAWANLTTI